MTVTNTQFGRSASSLSCHDYEITQQSPSIQSHLSVLNSVSPVNSLNSSNNNKTKCNNTKNQNQDQQVTMLIRSNPCYVQRTTNFANNASIMPNEVEESSSVANEITGNPSQCNCDASPSNLATKVNRKLNFTVLSKELSVDSESQEDDHNFSDLLNLSVCAPSSVTHLPLENLITTQSNQQELQQSFSVTNSMTSSDISSLANLGTPDSPPRATSPTVEMKELLDKIQQLPQQKSPLPDTPTNQQSKMRGYFNRTKAKTLYMPLYEGPSKQQTKMSPNSRAGTLGSGGTFFIKPSRGWLSRSAPNTPCGSFIPSFPMQKKSSGSQKGSKAKISDGSPLLNESEESDDDQHKDECL